MTINASTKEILDNVEHEVQRAANGSMKDIRRPFGAPSNLLTVREQTHGSFEENARVSQSLKLIMRGSPGWLNLCDVEREAMDMIALKFSRILSGKSLEKQHWEDVVGYGKLAENLCV